MEQMARNLVDAVNGFLVGKRYILIDRDPLYTGAFHRILRQSGAQDMVMSPSTAAIVRLSHDMATPTQKTWLQ